MIGHNSLRCLHLSFIDLNNLIFLLNFFFFLQHGNEVFHLRLTKPQGSEAEICVQLQSDGVPLEQQYGNFEIHENEQQLQPTCIQLTADQIQQLPIFSVANLNEESQEVMQEEVFQQEIEKVWSIVICICYKANWFEKNLDCEIYYFLQSALCGAEVKHICFHIYKVTCVLGNQCILWNLVFHIVGKSRLWHLYLRILGRDLLQKQSVHLLFLMGG